MESSTEDNQIHRFVLLDHKMTIEGKLYHEKKELQRIFTEDGVEMSNLSHMRTIGLRWSYGDRTYTANYKIVDGKVKDETIETSKELWHCNLVCQGPGETVVRRTSVRKVTMGEKEVAAFKKDWEDNWHPMIAERSTGVMKTFFKKLDDFPKYHL